MIPTGGWAGSSSSGGENVLAGGRGRSKRRAGWGRHGEEVGDGEGRQPGQQPWCQQLRRGPWATGKRNAKGLAGPGPRRVRHCWRACVGHGAAPGGRGQQGVRAQRRRSGRTDTCKTRVVGSARGALKRYGVLRQSVPWYLRNTGPRASSRLGSDAVLMPSHRAALPLPYPSPRPRSCTLLWLSCIATRTRRLSTARCRTGTRGTPTAAEASTTS